MNLATVKEMLRTSQNAYYTLGWVKPGSGVIGLHRYFPSIEGDEEEAGESKKKRPDAATMKKILEAGLEQLQAMVEGHDRANPGTVYTITYQAGRTSNGSGVLGPIEFTKDDPAPAPAPQPVPHHYPSLPVQQPGILDQVQSLVALAGMMNRPTEAPNYMVELYKDKILQLEAKERALDDEKRTFRLDMAEQRKLEKEERKQEIEDYKAALKAENDRVLKHELDQLNGLKKAKKKKKAELQAEIAKVQSSSHQIGENALGFLKKIGGLIVDDELNAPATPGGGLGAAQQQQPTEWDQVCMELAELIHSTNQPRVAALVGEVVQCWHQDPEGFARRLTNWMRGSQRNADELGNEMAKAAEEATKDEDEED